MPLFPQRDPELDKLPSPSADRSGRHHRDALLRSAGFAIHARPRQGEPLWRRLEDGAVLRESEAVQTMTRQQQTRKGKKA